ncbi:MAG: cytochrome P450 [Trueperaceae bacterium]
MLPPLFAENPKDFLLMLGRAHHECGDVFRLKFGNNETYVVAHPELAYEVLVRQKENYSKLGDAAGLARVLRKGILTNADYDSWFSHRRVLQQAFHKEAAKIWMHYIEGTAERLLERWRRLPTHAVVDIAEEMLAVTHEILYKLVFSLEASAIKEHPIFLPLTLATRKNNLVREAKRNVDGVLYKLIAQRREEMRGGKQFRDLLELLLTSQDADTGATMSDEEIRDELATVFAAGHDTTSHALTWTLYLLAQNPTVLSTLQRELKRAKVQVGELNTLPFTLATFKEGLRLYPTIPSIPRITLRDVILSGFEIPKGSRLFLSLYLIHRHKVFWQDANVFRPERFLETVQPKAYIPFGLGERYCLGKNLAMLQGPLLLAMIVKHVDFSLVPEFAVIPKVTVSLFPRGGLKMRLKIQDFNFQP